MSRSNRQWSILDTSTATRLRRGRYDTCAPRVTGQRAATSTTALQRHTHDTRHTTHDTRHTTHDTRHTTRTHGRAFAFRPASPLCQCTHMMHDVRQLAHANTAGPERAPATPCCSALPGPPRRAPAPPGCRCPPRCPCSQTRCAARGAASVFGWVWGGGGAVWGVRCKAWSAHAACWHGCCTHRHARTHARTHLEEAAG
jgi:hypothetical protein